MFLLLLITVFCNLEGGIVRPCKNVRPIASDQVYKSFEGYCRYFIWSGDSYTGVLWIFLFYRQFLIGGRLAFIGREKTIIVDSVWYTLEKPDPAMPNIQVEHIGFKNFTGSVSNLPRKLTLGDSVKIIYYEKF